MDGKNSSSPKRLRPGKENRPTYTLNRIHPVIRKQILQCFCSRPGKIITEPYGDLRHFVTCAKEDTTKRCIYLQRIDSSWITEANINVTQDVSRRKVLGLKNNTI